MLRFEKMTVKAQEAVEAAQEVAARHENQQIEPVHLLAALVAQADGVAAAKGCPRKLRARLAGCQRCKALPSSTWDVR